MAEIVAIADIIAKADVVANAKADVIANADADANTNISIYRYKFSNDIMDIITEFSKVHQLFWS